MNNSAVTTSFGKVSTKSQWLKWNYSEDMDPKIVMTRAVLTWIMLLVLYTCFQFSWQIVNQANNFQGPVYQLYPNSASDPMISRISNWSITLTRGFTAIILGLLITKIGHKNAVIFSIGMILCSFPALLTPLMKQSMIDSGAGLDQASLSSYVLFIIFRIFLAVGGTTINILNAPLIAKFFISQKQRNMAVKINNVPAQIAGILASVIFIEVVAESITGAAAGSVAMSQNWQLISGVVLGIVAVVLVAYMFIGMHFRLSTPKTEKTEFTEADKGNGLLKLLKQPKVIFFTLAMVFLMYAGVEPGSGVLSSFWKTTGNNVPISWDIHTGLTTGVSTVTDTMLIWQILYTSSIFVALFTVMRWSNTKYPLSPYCGIMTILGCALWGASIGMGAAGLATQGYEVACIILGFMGSILIFGAQSMMYIVPYKWGLTNSQLTSYTGFLWTAMYVGYSLLDIITAFVGSAGVSANIATLSDYIANHTDQYVGLFNQDSIASNVLTPELMSDYYGKIKNVLLGTSEANINLAQYAIDGINVFRSDVVMNILNQGTVDQSVANLNNQYIGQAILIPVAPAFGGVALFFVKKEDFELKFTWKHFKENHLHFTKTKELFKKIGK